MDYCKELIFDDYGTAIVLIPRVSKVRAAVGSVASDLLPLATPLPSLLNFMVSNRLVI